MNEEKQKKIWCWFETSDQYLDGVKLLFKRLLNQLKIKFDKNNESSIEENSQKPVNKWMEFGYSIYEAINDHPDLTIYNNIAERNQDIKINK